MSNFGDMITRVADDLDRQDINPQIERELRRAVQHYERSRWWFNETVSTLTATSSTASISPPSDLLVLDFLEIVNGSRPLKLNEMTWERFIDEWRPATTTGGQPSDYAWYSDQVWLGPVPAQDYPLVWHYIKTLSPASFTSGTENAWTNFGEDLITARALKTLGARPLQVSGDTVLTWQELERQAYMALCGLNEQKLMTGLARPWSG